MGNQHFAPRSSGPIFDLGVVKMQLLAGSADTNRGFAQAEWDGSEGPWTIPHVHRETQESFYILNGEFTFEVGDQSSRRDPRRTCSSRPKHRTC